MTPEESELRRALEARSSAPSPDFQTRVSAALRTARPAPRPMPALALVAGLVLTVTTVGVLVYARHALAPVSHGGPASASRTTTPSPLIGPGAVDLSAPSATVVWGLVDNGPLYVSTDGGSTWQKRLPPPNLTGAPHAISFLDDRNGWAMYPGAPVNGCGNGLARIWRTTDGALTWQLAAEVDFRPQSLGGEGFQDCKDTLTFVDGSHGFATTWNDGSHPAVWRTSDGGKTWSESIIADPVGFSTQKGGYYLQFGTITRFGAVLMAPAFGEQPGGSTHEYVFKSVDHGATWTAVASLTNQPSDLTLVTPARWLIIVPGGSMETTDGGRSWHPYTTDYYQAAGVAPQVVFPDPEVGYASLHGAIQRTDDGGAHWTYIQSPGVITPPSPNPSPLGQAPFYEPGPAQLSAPSSSVVWMLYGEANLYLSTDQGTTWQHRPTPTEPINPTDISFIDGREGWYLQGGPGGTQCSFGPASLWHTTDAGATWKLIARVDLSTDEASSARTVSAFVGIRGDQCKQGLSFVDRTHGFIEAWDPNGPPTIYRTADGGASWLASTLPDPPGFKTDDMMAQPVQRFGPVLLVAAYQLDSDRGFVFQSTDGGATWRYLVTLPTLANAVTMVSASRWLIVVAGQSLETLDAGKTWHAFATDYHQPADVPPDVVFANSLDGYSLVDTGLQKTVDGGAHWMAVKTPGS